LVVMGVDVLSGMELLLGIIVEDGDAVRATCRAQGCRFIWDINSNQCILLRAANEALRIQRAQN
jgi:hypothetical protein